MKNNKKNPSGRHQKVNMSKVIVMSEDWTKSEALAAIFSAPEREVIKYRFFSELTDALEHQEVNAVGFILLPCHPRNACEFIYKIRNKWPHTKIIFFSDVFLFSDNFVARYFSEIYLYSYKDINNKDLIKLCMTNSNPYAKSGPLCVEKKLSIAELICDLNYHLMIELQGAFVSFKMKRFIFSEKNNALKLYQNKKTLQKKTKMYYYYRETLMSYLQIKNYARDFLESIYIKNIDGD